MHKMKDLEFDEYLQRIKIAHCKPTLEGLTKLQQSHMQNIPFENLDIIVKRKIHLDFENLFKKIVKKNRGGYCFELNILYSYLLKHLGFEPKPVLGRVWLRNPTKTPPRNHLAHLVKLNGETFVTDVGFGGLTTRIPLNINDNSEAYDKDGFVRISPFSVNQFMIQRKVDNKWENQYSFEDVDISEEDIYISNYYMSTNPKSHFYNANFIGKYTNDGRVGLYNNQMSKRNGIEVTDKKNIAYGKDWIDALKTQFDLEIDFSESELQMIFKHK